tara:strand:+ start:708 stop:980 length:273 start_codon:yes stop_codon:yes gene_type:complete
MTRKKVTTEVVNTSTQKKRPTPPKVVVKPEKETPTRWDKIIGVNGKIVRHKMDDQEKAIEMGQLISKGKSRRLYSGVDGNFTYLYFEITE